MRPTGVAVLVLFLAGLTASPTYGAARSIDVKISAHPRSDYRFTYDYVDRTDPDCPQTIKASSRVVTDMPTVRPARFRIKRVAGSYAFLKRLGGRQRAVRAIDMRAEMTRSTEGGSETPCTGYEPYPTMRCGKRSWALDGLPRMGGGRFFLSLDVPVFPSLRQVMEDDVWRRGGCGYDSTAADEYITSLDDGQGHIKPSYVAPISIKRLFRPGRRTLRLRESHTFTVGKPNQLGGTSTEVRTVEVTVRKLR